MFIKKYASLLIIISIIIFIWITAILLNMPDKTFFYREIIFSLILVLVVAYTIHSLHKDIKTVLFSTSEIDKIFTNEKYFPIITSKNRKIIYTNKKFLKLTGQNSPLFILGRDIREIFSDETYNKINEFLSSDKEREWKLIEGYIKTRDKNLKAISTLTQKFYYDGDIYESFDIFDKDLTKFISVIQPVYLASIINNISDIITFLDPEYNIQWINQPGERYLNKKTNEIIGKKCYKILFEREDRCTGCPFYEKPTTGDPIKREVKLPDGKYFAITITPVKDDQGKIIGLITIMRDITDQKEAEIKKMETEARVGLIAEQLPTLIWTVDENLKVTYVNGAILKNLKLSKESIIGKTLYEFLNQTNPEYPVIKHALLALTGESGSYQIKIMNRNYIVYYKPLINPENKIIGCVGISQDITEIINIQNELEERNYILSVIGDINRIISHSKSENEMIEEIIMSLTKNNNIANVIYFIKDNTNDSIIIDKVANNNSMLKEIFEIKMNATYIEKHPLLLSYIDMEIKFVNDVEKTDLPSEFKLGLEKLGYKSLILIPIIIEDRVHSIFCLTSESKDYFKNINYYKNIADDISVAIKNFTLQEKQKENLEIIRKNQLMMVKAQKYEYASRFASQLSHDFNNILFSIKSYLTIIRSSIATDNMIENYLNQIDAAIHKGGELTSYLMKYSNYESCTKVRTNADLLFKIISENISELCNEKSVKFVSENKCDSTYLHCDTERITEALNIAARYIINRSMSYSTIYLRLNKLILDQNSEEETDTLKNNMLKIELMTDSILSNEDLSDDIFAIRLLSKSDKQPEFNLPVADNIIRLHGGYIYADRRKDLSGFVIILPIIYEPSNITEYKFSISDNKKNILIVEDDPYVKEPLEIILGGLNCNILTAPDGAEALKLLRRLDIRIDILITDVEMPIVDGITLAEEIHKVYKDVKIIYISGYIKDFASKEKRLIPDSFFLQKPFQMDSLKKIVMDVIKSG